MSDKLINIDYKSLDAQTTAGDPQAKLVAEITQVEYETSVTVPVKNTAQPPYLGGFSTSTTISGHETSVTIPVKTTQEVTYLDKLTVVVTGAGETSIPTSGQFKRLADQVQNLQDSLQKALRLVKASAADASDAVTKRPRKQLVELLDPQSLARFTSRRVSLDTADVGDSVAKRAGKTTPELFFAQDTRALLVQKSAISLVADTDIARLSTTKRLTTVADASDLFNTTAVYNRSFAHSVDATDDFFGAGNIDDDQVARVTKVLASWLSITELQQLKLSVIKSSAATGVDTLALRPTKRLNTFVVSQDTASLVSQYTRNFLSTAQFNDSRVVRTSKSLITPVVFQQQTSKRISRSVLDFFVKQDLAYLAPNKAARDTIVSSEVLSTFLYTNRFFYELIATSSSGFINNQSYFAGTYVTPGYVGTNTYF